MNRFKFRVWDIVNSKYIPGNRLHVNHDGSLSSCVENIIVEQSTGLTDKNGKEIFEGDMLIYEGGVSGEVCYDYNRACFCMKWDDGENTLFQKYWDYNDIEIIGNIHEVPNEA